MSTFIRTRYAPSPTGDPHIGNIRTGLFAYLAAKHTGGSFLLRIEDTDKAREVPGSFERIKESLLWLGLQWDEEPIFQSQRLPLYQKYAKELVNKGHAYYCFCSQGRLAQVREEQAKKGLPPRYDKHCRNLTADEVKERLDKEPHVIRLKVPQTGETVVRDLVRGNIIFRNNTIDDQVLLKSDGFPTYHLAVVVDDHAMNISHTIRGDDWIPSAPKHVLLYQFLGWPIPEFVHPALIVGKDKKKLSKRLGDMSVLAYKDQGYHPLAMLNFLVRLGFSPKQDRKLYRLEELIKEFELTGLHKNPAIFDTDKLQWFNRLAKEGTAGETNLMATITNILQEHNIIGNPPTDMQYTFVREASKRIDTADQTESVLRYLWEDPNNVPINSVAMSHSQTEKKALLAQIAKTLLSIGDWQEATIGNQIRELAKSRKDWASKDFYQLLTVVVTGSLASPPLFASLALLGKDVALQRLQT